MSAVDYDVIIIGQGIAGTTLAWTLEQAGKRTLLFDDYKANTSSKIAAGLITPITGKRFVLNSHFATYYECARTFYHALEKVIKTQVFQETVSHRYVRTPEEKAFWAKRKNDPLYAPYIAGTIDGGEGFAMTCARLDVATYLEAAHAHLKIEKRSINWNKEVFIHAHHVNVAGLTSSYLVSCEGFSAAQNPYFNWVPFNAAKGEILTIRFSEDRPVDISHFGLWMAPLEEKNCFLVGATYDWERHDDVPTPEGRQEIVKRLSECVSTPFEVLDHRAAVRPIIFQSMAAIGVHPEHNRLGFFNGLGSKGSLHAPYFAKALSAYLFERGKIDPDSNVQKYWPL